MNDNKDFDIEADEVIFHDKRRINEKGERINGDEPESVVVEPAKTPEVQALEDQLSDVTARCEAAELKLKDVQRRFEEERAKLEQETAERRERMIKSLGQKAESGRFDFLSTLLPVLDNLTLAIDAGEREASFDHLLSGVKGTARSFEQALLSVGVEPVAAIGELFDPQLHEAVEMVISDAEDEGKVVGEFTRGFTYNGRLLRAARVQVGSGNK